MIVSFWTTKKLFFPPLQSPLECFVDSQLIHFWFKVFRAHELLAGLIPRMSRRNAVLPSLPPPKIPPSQGRRALALRRPQIITGFISILQMFFSFP